MFGWMEVSMNGDTKICSLVGWKIMENLTLRWMMTGGTTIYENHHLTKNIKLHNQTMGNINKNHGAFMLSTIIATGFVVMITIVYLSIHPSIHLSIHLSIYPSIHLSICPSVHLSICPSVHLSICPSNQSNRSNLSNLSSQSNLSNPIYLIYLSIYLSI